MTAASISRICTKSNPYYSLMGRGLRLSPCHNGGLRRLCQLPICPIAHQDFIGTRQPYAFEAALLVSDSVLQYEAVGLQITMLLRKADPVFSLLYTYSAYGECVPKGCWHTIGVTPGEPSPPLALGQRRYSCSQGLGAVGELLEKGIRRAIEHTAARQGRDDRMA